MYIVSCNKSATVTNTFLGYILLPLSSRRVIDFKAFAITFHYKQVFKFVKIIHVLNFVIVLSILNGGRLVVFYTVYYISILAHHAQLYNVICEFNPLKTLIVIHVNLSKQVDKITNHFCVCCRIILFTQVILLGHNCYECIKV